MLQGILIASLFFGVLNVNAEQVDEIFFTNKNNVSFTKFQYDTLVDAIGLYSVLNMSSEDYDIMEVSMLAAGDTKIEVLEDYDVIDENEEAGISTLTTMYHETNYKKLTGATTCKDGYDYCLLTIALEWKKNPSVRSYDVIGTLLFNSSFYDNSCTAVAFMNGGSTAVPAQKMTSRGRAVAIKLSSTGNINAVTLTIKITESGKAQVSYQHAVKTITQFTALNFDFSSAGMGGVFGYPDRYVGNYDDMAGLSVKVA